MEDYFFKKMIAIAEGVRKFKKNGFQLSQIDGWYPEYPIENQDEYFSMDLQNKCGEEVRVGLRKNNPGFADYYEVTLISGTARFSKCFSTDESQN